MFSMSGFMGTIVVLIILFWLLVVGSVVFLVVYLVRSSDRQQNQEKEKPIEILKERYAKGEISKEEFEEKKKELSRE